MAGRRRGPRGGAHGQPKQDGRRRPPHVRKERRKPGEAGTVAWLFERRGIVLVDAGADEDELTLAAAEGGADDVSLDGSSYQVVAAPESPRRCERRSRRPGSRFESAELTMVPRTTIELGDEAAAKKVLRLIDALEDSDDVQDVYANFDIPERVLDGSRLLAHPNGPARSREALVQRGANPVGAGLHPEGVAAEAIRLHGRDPAPAGAGPPLQHRGNCDDCMTVEVDGEAPRTPFAVAGQSRAPAAGCPRGAFVTSRAAPDRGSSSRRASSP